MTIHIATSADLGRVVRRGLQVPVCTVPVSDNWLVGPCGAALEVYPRSRCDFWGMQGRERAQFLRSFREMMKVIDSRRRIVIWMSRLGGDTIAFWALCAWRLLRWPDQPNLGLVVLGGPTEADDTTGVGSGFIRVTPADARHSLGQMRSLSLTRVREMALFWRKLSGSAPILYSKGDRTARGREQLFELGAYQAGFFPRFDVRGLVLARFDELLFSCLENHQWSTPAEVFVRRGATGEELRKWLGFTGDFFLAIRLAQWARHNGSDAALVSEPCQGRNEMTAVRYRLSDMGHAIKDHGLADTSRGAPLPVWGATAYDPLAPWVVVDDHTGRQRIQHLGELARPDVKG